MYHGKQDVTLEMLKKTLGVLPDHGMRGFLGVAGRHDISFLQKLSAILSWVESDIPGLGAAEKAGHLTSLLVAASIAEVWSAHEVLARQLPIKRRCTNRHRKLLKSARMKGNTLSGKDDLVEQPIRHPADESLGKACLALVHYPRETEEGVISKRGVVILETPKENKTCRAQSGKYSRVLIDHL